MLHRRLQAMSPNRCLSFTRIGACILTMNKYILRTELADYQPRLPDIPAPAPAPALQIRRIDPARVPAPQHRADRVRRGLARGEHGRERRARGARDAAARAVVLGERDVVRVRRARGPLRPERLVHLRGGQRAARGRRGRRTGAVMTVFLKMTLWGGQWRGLGRGEGLTWRSLQRRDVSAWAEEAERGGVPAQGRPR